MPALLRTFDVFCYVTSTAVECHPLALIEASAAGIPVVAEAKGGVPGIVRDGENGCLVRSADEIPRCVHRLRHDAALRREIGERGRLIAAGFSVEAHVARYEALIERVAGRPRMHRG